MVKQVVVTHVVDHGQAKPAYSITPNSFKYGLSRPKSRQETKQFGAASVKQSTGQGRLEVKRHRESIMKRSCKIDQKGRRSERRNE
ncbi:Uncharacterized protein HZ326_1917 [Fusarium oxysporum f. sp. albedinis]|nr:Uncharacterized protein HZ326_1917 [Fusarium oxysporum f. sp. albedinis]